MATKRKEYTIENGALVLKGTMPVFDSDNNITLENNLIIPGSITKKNGTATYSQTLQNKAGTIALTSDIPSTSNFIPYGGVLMPTNPFGGKTLYINHTDNAFASADKKLYVTVTKHLKESGGVSYPYADTSKSITDDDYYVDGPITQILTTSAHNLFNGSYEDGITCEANGTTYLKIRIMFGSNTSPSGSSSYFTGYPYGYWYLSFYYNNTPNLVSQARVYNKYSAHTVGWHLYNATWYSGSASGTNVIHLITDTMDYQRTCVDFIVYGNTSSGRAVQITQIDYRLQRPNLSRDGSTVTKYGAQTLYWDFAWNNNHAETIKIGADGNVNSTKFTLKGNAISPASGQYVAVYNSDGFQRTTSAFDGSTTNKFLSQKGTFESYNNYYHTSGSWTDLTYNATNNGGVGDLSFTIPTGTTGTTVCVGNDSRLSDARTPIAHASTATTYGAGTTTNYGHVKIITGDLNGISTATNGEAASTSHTHSQYATTSNTYTKTEVDGLISDVTEIAEGKTATYVISYTTTGTNVVNSNFNSTNADIAIGNSSTNQLKDTSGNLVKLEDLRLGDVILVTEVDVPDRWVSTVGSGAGTTIFSQLETTKVDITNMVTASGNLTSSQIITGSGSKAVAASGVSIAKNSTGVTDSDTYVPTSKAVKSYVTGLGYITTITPSTDTIRIIDSSQTTPIATTTINGITSVGTLPSLANGDTQATTVSSIHSFSGGSVPTRAQFTYATGSFSTAASLSTINNTFTKGTSASLTGTYTAGTKNFAISFTSNTPSNIQNESSVDVSSFKSVNTFTAPVLSTSTAYQITDVGSIASINTTNYTWSQGTLPTMGSSTTVVTNVATTTKSVVTDVTSS